MSRKITTKKLSEGRYRVYCDNAETRLIIEKGEPPKYRQLQNWSILLEHPDGAINPLTDDQRGLDGAKSTVANIINGCQ